MIHQNERAVTANRVGTTLKGTSSVRLTILQRLISRAAAVHEGSALLLVLALLVGCSHERITTTPTVRYASAIENFLKADEKDPTPKHAILFIGSSIFRQWKNLKEHMAPLPVFNRAFGGSRTSDILTHMDKIVLPYEPRIIVYYCGSNDVNASEKAGDIANRFKAFFWRVSEKLPETNVYFVSINRAPQKKTKWNVVDSTNAIIKDFCASSTKLGFIDVNPLLFDGENNPRFELYRDDQLHFKDTAYVEFASLIRPIIERAWYNR